MAGEDQSHRAHRPSKKKKEKGGDKQSGQPNPKAFAYSAPGRLARTAARSHDIREKRLHVPLVDRLPEEAPPLVVGVVGPPGVGKTTLIKSLTKRYSKQTVSDPQGPITVVTGKRRRLTIIECPSNSLASAVDLAKVVDIVLLMIDGNYGFEMETMEFLSVLSSTGMPGNVFGILTHLDLFRKQEALKAQKKRLKHRFWSELYQGAKLFYLSGVINGRYPDREVLNLTRFLSVMKNPRPLVWRNSHPYAVADRMLDLTPPTLLEENDKCDRTVALYGYLRGTNIPAKDAHVHIPGVGDVTVEHVEALPDPCPTPYYTQAQENQEGAKKRKRLGDKQKLIYAPMSDVGGVLVDKDAVYIDVKSNTFDEDEDDEEERGFGEQMMMGLQGGRKMLGDDDDKIALFEGGQKLKDVVDTGRTSMRNVAASASHGDDGAEIQEDVDDIEFADSDSDLGSLDEEEVDVEDVDEDVDGDDFDEQAYDSDAYESDESNNALWKKGLSERAHAAHSRRQPYRIAELARIMYDEMLSTKDILKMWAGKEGEEEDDEANDDDDLFHRRREAVDDEEDRLIPQHDYAALEAKWESENARQALNDRFSSRSAGAIEDDGDSEGDGEFEDLEDLEDDNADNDAGESDEGSEPDTPDEDTDLNAEREKNAKRKEELKLRFEEEDREGFLNPKNTNKQASGAAEAEEFGEDEWYDAQKALLQKQQDINRKEFESLDESIRVRAEGYKAGTYVRMTLSSVPCEFVKNFDARYPIIIGGLQPTEERMGFVQVRIKRHRWHKKILKTNDPLIFSLGWRRFQSMPVYSISDSRVRNRMLKYTPEHMHCFGTFYGPLAAPNTSFCCVQSFSNKNPGFRIAATGTVLSVDEGTEIVKKLKLTGHPYKIFKNTAFIKDMFASSLEIAKFEGASIKTVSGVRGQIKKALSKPDGCFRATFEDKVLMSDIVFLRAWYPVRPHRFYNTVTNLLDSGEAGSWTGMRLTGQVRAEQGIATPSDRNSAYRPVERQERHFNPLRVPRKLQAELPFKSQITRMKPSKKDAYTEKRAVVVGGEEKTARRLMQQVMTLRRAKEDKRAKKQEERKEGYRKKVEENAEKRREREKKERDNFWQREGRKRRNDGEDSGGGKRRR